MGKIISLEWQSPSNTPPNYYFIVVRRNNRIFKERMKGRSPFNNNLPPLLLKERGIKGVRLIHNLYRRMEAGRL